MRAQYPSISEALRAMNPSSTSTFSSPSSRGSSFLAGIIPFHSHHTPTLFSPQSWGTMGSSELTDQSVSPLPLLKGIQQIPSLSDHESRIRSMIKRVQSGEIEKIVLSRQEIFSFEEELNPVELYSRFLRDSTTGDGHFIQIPQDKTYVLGASPELLISKKGADIYSFPLAGTVAHHPDPALNAEMAQRLRTSMKDNDEHRFVTQEIERILAPYCLSLSVPQNPTLLETSHTWHLGTPIRGKLKDPHTPVLELVSALHPTPAVGGYPTSIAQDILQEEEPSRGFYAGAVGWMNNTGDGEWRVVIRSATLSGTHVSAHAGGGIVAQSIPEEEVEETTTKLGPVRRALGLTPTP